MKPAKWWIQSGIVYGVTALIGVALMWYTGNWHLARVSWLMAVVSVAFFVGGAVKHFRARANPKRNIGPARR